MERPARVVFSHYASIPPFPRDPCTPKADFVKKLAARWDGVRVVTQDVIRCIVRENGALVKLRDIGCCIDWLGRPSLAIGEVYMAACEIRDHPMAPQRFRRAASFWIEHVTPAIGRALTDRLRQLRQDGSLNAELARNAVDTSTASTTAAPELAGEYRDGSSGGDDDASIASTSSGTTFSSHQPPHPYAGTHRVNQAINDLRDAGRSLTPRGMGVFYAHFVRDLMENQDFPAIRVRYLQALGQMLKIVEDSVATYDPVSEPPTDFVSFVLSAATHALKSPGFDTRWGQYNLARMEMRKAELAVISIALKAAREVHGASL